MKTNLKNRPKNLFPDYHSDCRRLLQHYEEWFKDFEKELREIQKNQVPLYKKTYIKIEEILGEE